jgi:hypothetical protein
MAFVVAALVLAAAEWVARRPWWELAGAAVVLVLVAAGGWRARCAIRRMRAADLTQITARVQAVRAEAFPQVSRVEERPAVVNHYHQDIHIHGGVPAEVAAVIRAIPGQAEGTGSITP